MDETQTRRQKEQPSTDAPRRRKNGGSVVGNRLGVNANKLDFDRFSYRWINDTMARIHAKTRDDDWDIVTNEGGVKDDNADLGNAVSQIVGAKPNGEPLRAYLCRKPKTYFEDDQKDKLADLDRQLEQIRRGHTDGKPLETDEYVPTSGIRL